MGATIPTPVLLTAQIMADLDSLYSCDHSAATNLLNASKKISPLKLRRRSRASVLPEPPKFDKLGKRIVEMPSMSRINSDASSMGGRSGGESDASTGSRIVVENPYEKDDDMRRAKELVTLFEAKDNVRRLGTEGLGKSKKRVDELAKKYHEKQVEERQRAAKGRHSEF